MGQIKSQLATKPYYNTTTFYRDFFHSSRAHRTTTAACHQRIQFDPYKRSQHQQSLTLLRCTSRSSAAKTNLTIHFSLKAADLIVQTLPDEKRAPKPAWDKLLFGHHCSDHMIKIRWTKADGWDTPTIVPVHNFSMHPYSKVFHYAQEVNYKNTNKQVFKLPFTCLAF